MTIQNPEKIGLGTWDEDNRGSALNHVDRLGFHWHYNWSDRPLWDADVAPERSAWTAMLWDETDVTADALLRVAASGTDTLLGFNEPNHPGQADMTVGQALALWERVQDLDIRLGSPAATQGGALGPGSWLGRFMEGAEARDLRVDFIAVHYYSEDGDLGAFRDFLTEVHERYDRPLWVTEWALADWDRPNRFSAAEQAAFARAGIEMMDDLRFVERHAWYSGYDGDEGLNAEVFRLDGTLTPVGRAFQAMLDPAPDILGTGGADVLVGGARDEEIRGLSGADRLLGGRGSDRMVGGGGRDELAGGRDGDRLWGADGADRIVGGRGGDRLKGGEGADRLDGGSGSDRLRGGGGTDRFVFADGQDRITDFQDDVDVVLIDSGLWGGGVRSRTEILDLARWSDGVLVLDFGQGDVLRIEGLERIADLRDDLILT